MARDDGARWQLGQRARGAPGVSSHLFAVRAWNAPRNAYGTLPHLSFGHVDRHGPGPMDSIAALEDCYV